VARSTLQRSIARQQPYAFPAQMRPGPLKNSYLLYVRVFFHWIGRYRHSAGIPETGDCHENVVNRDRAGVCYGWDWVRSRTGQDRRHQDGQGVG
jgi:hypothetical protein